MPSTTYRQLLLRRDLKANIPALAVGEPFFCTDTKELFIGSSSGNVKIDVDYSPAVPGNWTTPAPTTLDAAMDRVAAALNELSVKP